ncbi:hypothetical protein FGADI_6495 [Fusarium gaditjirri]|uniref:Choline/carnitine acyltransferase domain-containing protein n=1 Tax=Fusarium gaditjirri TaxID=282569 RepID=A0A8H4WVW6_9HYPO|nr:hypothetical protein FGADI_6495 [Fusarium gaditjirri]
MDPKLRAQADDLNVESWMTDLLLKALHLKRRYPLTPFVNFLGTHFDSPTVHIQAERAAILTTALCAFKADLVAGRLEPDFLRTKANCGHSLSWLFNAVRELNVDKMIKYPGNEYVAVLRKGHLFKVPLEHAGTTVSYDLLKATYQAFVDLDLKERSWAGMLTTDNRDAWGLIIITANGRSATIFEHYMTDLTTVSQLSQRLQNAINTLDLGNTAASDGAIAIDSASLKLIPLVTTEDIESRIETLRYDYLAITSTKQYVPHLINSFGKTLLPSHSVPIKATFDLTIQLASRLYFGYLPAKLGDRIDGTRVMAQDQKDEEIPELFSDPVWKRGYPELIMQTMVETKPAEDSGFTMPHPESVWMIYTVFDDSVEVCFVSPTKSADRFIAALDRAEDLVKDIISERVI